MATSGKNLLWPLVSVSQSTMAETLWNVSGLGFKVAIAGSQPHKEKVGKAGQRTEEERPTDKGLPVMFCFCH